MFLSGCTHLLRSLWPPSLPQYANEASDISSVEKPHGTVPRDAETFGHWCYIERDASIRNPTRNQYLAYQPQDDETNSVQEVVVRFQGFIKDLQLSQFGNWSGYVLVK